MFLRNAQLYTGGVVLTREVNNMAKILLCILLLIASATTATGAVLQVGAKAPPFVLPDLFGRTISLDYFDGHPGVLVFWSAANPRSVELLYDFREYQEKWGKNDLAIIAVNTDGGTSGVSNLKTVRDYADSLNIIYPMLIDSGQATLSAYGVSEVPTAVVIDAGGRISAILRGSLPTLREELKEGLLIAVAGGPHDAASAVVAKGSEQEGATRAAGETPANSCGISRARSCTNIDERDPSASDPAVMAVRLCVCHGDADAAQLMLTGVSKESLLGLDLRFALAHMTLVKGRITDATRAFEALRDHYPQAGWGEWGLGLVALGAGDAEGALGHIRAARTGGWSIPEIETAVLKYLEGYWRVNRTAPQEEQFLALFEELNSVRVCYRKLNQRG